MSLVWLENLQERVCFQMTEKGCVKLLLYFRRHPRLEGYAAFGGGGGGGRVCAANNYFFWKQLCFHWSVIVLFERQVDIFLTSLFERQPAEQYFCFVLSSVTIALM